MIEEVDFSSIKKFKEKKFSPVLFIYKKEGFSLALKQNQIDTCWELFFKIFFNRFYNDNKDLFDDLFDKKMFQSDKSSGFFIFSHSDDKLNNKRQNKVNKVVKFEKDSYVKCFNIDYNNLLLFKKYIVNNCNECFKLFVCLNEDIGSDEFNKEYKKLERKYKKLNIKKSIFVASHINGKILNDYEKFIKYVRKEFKTKKLIGDIKIDQNQENILNKYMRTQLFSFAQNSIDFSPDYPRLFALGLVRYAMRNYNKKHLGEFWPYFQDEYGVKIDPIKQKYLHNKFEEILKNDKLSYFENSGNKIDNIIMHTFVSDNSASQLFDFLFDFWRIDLLRNIDNLNNEENKVDLFDELIKIMEIGNQEVRSHTSLLLKFPKLRPIFKNRVKRILRMIEDSFWNETEIKETGNRINHLLRLWMNDERGSFKKERRYVDRIGKQRGEKLFRSPFLKMNSNTGRVYLFLPSQRLIKCNKDYDISWEIRIRDTLVKSVPIDLKMDKIGYYIDYTVTDLELNDILSNIKISLCNGNEVIKEYEIKSSNIRIFDKDGKNIDYNKYIIPEGNLCSYSNSENYPYVLGETKKDVTKIYDLYLKNLSLIKGQILVLDNGMAVQIGNRLAEGFAESYPLKGAIVKDDNDKNYDIYNKLPKLLFRAKPEELEGISLCINGKNNRVSDFNLVEFKFSDDLNTLGYLLDLEMLINSDGLYNIYLDYPKYKRKDFYNSFAYIKNFEFKFNQAPYIFKEIATLRFNKIRFNELFENKSIELSDLGNGFKDFTFNFAEKSPDKEGYCEFIKDEDLVLNFMLNNKQCKMSFYIPTLYWKYKEDEEWNVRKPQDISLKELKKDKKKLYLSGPFDFAKSCIYTDEDIEIAEEESEIRCKDLNNPSFDLSKVYDWFSSNKECFYRRINLKLDKNSIQFTRIICRSFLVDVNLIADFDNQVLHGETVIRGDESYTVSIYHNGKIICEDKQVIDNKFDVECEIETGDYEIKVYEIEESDSDGFDIEQSSYLLNEKPIVKKLINLSNLENEIIFLKGYQDKENKYARFKFASSAKYYIADFKLYSFDDLINEGTIIEEDEEITNLYSWDNDIDYSSNEDLEKFIWYKANLKVERQNGTLVTISNLIVMFTNKTDLKTMHVFILDANDDYAGLLIHKYQQKIVTATQYKQYDRIQKRCSEMFDDNLNYFLFEFKED